MSFLNLYTRGGQLALHKFRMVKQIVLATATICFCVGVAVFVILFLHQTTSQQRRFYAAYLQAEFEVNMHANDPKRATQTWRDPSGQSRTVRSRTVRSLDILQNPVIQQQIASVDQITRRLLPICWGSGGVTLFLCVVFFVYRGHVKSKKTLERGNHCCTAQELSRLLRYRRQASDLTLDRLPLLKEKETSHILITGTTGSGKTNCFHVLLPQIRRRANRAIVVDLTGDFVAHYYREGYDLLLNPFDLRSQTWCPWAECLHPTHFDTLASAIVPQSTSTDRFWENAGKALLSAALEKLGHRQNPSIQRLGEVLISAPFKEFSQFFEGTCAAPYTHPDGEKMTHSIRATLATHLQGFRYLPQPYDPFSLRKWIAAEESDRDQWVFLTALPDQRETLQPLLSAWLDTAMNGLMSLPPDPQRRVWFLMDELPALQRLPSLNTILAEGRKYGGCVLAGIQSVPQFSSLYGHHSAQSILDLFNTKIFFRNTDPNTTQWISKVLGEAETTEQLENLSYGAHTMRDGISLSPHTRTKPLVLPTEIANLKDLEAFIKLPGDYPAAKLHMTYRKKTSISKPFIPTALSSSTPTGVPHVPNRL